MILIIMQAMSLIMFGICRFFNKTRLKESLCLLIISEVITILYAGIYFAFSRDFVLLLTGVVSIIGLYISYIDIKTRVIEPKLNIAIIVVAILFAFFRTDIAFYNPVITGIIMFLLLKVMHKLSKQQIGEGDVKLIVAYSVVYGFSKIISVLFYSLLSCLIVGVVLMIIKKKNMKLEVPFAPFMVAGAVFFDILSHLR